MTTLAIAQPPRYAGAVVLYANGLGDTIINRPALAALAARLPRPVRLVCGNGRGDFLWNGLGFDDIVRLPMQRLDDGGRDFDLEAIPVEYGDCEVFATMVPWFSASLNGLVDRLRPARSYGLGRGFDVNLPLDYRKNSVELGFDVVRAIFADAEIGDYRVALSFDDDCERKVALLFDSIASAGYRRVLAVHTESLAGKQWSAARFRDVLCATLERCEDAVAVLVDYVPSEDICSCHAHKVLRMPGLLLQNATNIVTHCDVFLGIDSCMLHAADLAGVPGVALFGPDTDPREFGYYWTDGKHLRFSHHDDAAPVDAVIEELLRRLRAAQPRDSGTSGAERRTP